MQRNKFKMRSLIIILAHSFMDRFCWKFVWMLIYHKDTIITKNYMYMTLNVTFMSWRSFVIFYMKTFWPNYNLDLCSNGQLLSLFCKLFNYIELNAYSSKTILLSYLILIIFVKKLLKWYFRAFYWNQDFWDFLDAHRTIPVA